jgi:hypothetical protein
MAKNKTLEHIHDTIEKIAESIAGEHSHGYSKHCVRGGEFRRAEYGEPLEIDNAEDLKRHAYLILVNHETLTIHTVGLRFYAYHPPTRTLCVINPGTGDLDGGTIYRVPLQADAEGLPWHARPTERDAETLNVRGFKDRPGGLLARLQADARLSNSLAHAYGDMKSARDKKRRQKKHTEFKLNEKDVARKHRSRNGHAAHAY